MRISGARLAACLVAVVLVLGLAAVSWASDEQKAVSKCGAEINKNSTKLIAALQKIMLKCYAKKHACLTATNPAQCRADADSHKDCSCETLGIDYVDMLNRPSKAKKTADIIALKIRGKCDPAFVPLVTPQRFLDKDGNGVGLRFRKTRNAKCGDIVGDNDGDVEDLDEALECIVKLAAMQAAMQVGWDADPAARKELADLAAADQCNVVGVAPGPIVVEGPCDMQVHVPAAAHPAGGAPFRFMLDIGAPQAGRIFALRAAGPFAPIRREFPGLGVTVCAEFGCDTEGVLCCNPAGCPALLSKSFDVNQDHDSTANGGFGPHEARPLDVDCRRTASNAVSTLPPFVTTPCREGKARSSACNREGLGEASATSHAPRCDGGGRVNLFCDPGLALATECPGLGTSCSSRSTLPAANLVNSPCNGPMTVVNAAPQDDFDEGDMVLQTSLQLTVHRDGLDVVDYIGECDTGPNLAAACNEDSDCGDCVGGPTPGADCDADVDCGGMGGVCNAGTCTCSNKTADGKADGFGCDGVACTEDDTTPKQDPVKVSFTTGTTSSTIFDRNMASGFDLTTGPVTGAVPADACVNLIDGDATGYVLYGTFPIIDDPVLGDLAIDVKLDW